jgi:hypothetical protein
MSDETRLTCEDVTGLMVDVYSRYRRGEVDDKTAYRETYMLKAIQDGLHRAQEAGREDVHLDDLFKSLTND